MSGYRFEKLRFLVVDDNQHMRKLIITILQAFGTKTIAEAADGEKAIALMRDFTPDVIFVDWAMEGMSGIDFAKTLRTSTQTRNPFVPIIMITGHTSADHVRQARDAGINEFLAKPVSVKGILTRLTAVIEHPRPFVRTNSYFGPCRRRRASQDYNGPERRAATASTDPPKAVLAS